MRGALGLALLSLLTSPTLAQEASVKETRCWVGDVTFSAGSGINAGKAVAVCEAGIGWTEAEAGAPVLGCLLEGELSSVGAVVGIRNNDSLLIQCDASGRTRAASQPIPSRPHGEPVEPRGRASGGRFATTLWFYRLAIRFTE